MKLNSGKLLKGFVLAKPISQEGYDESVIYGLERNGQLVITRKRDGWKLLAHFDSRGKIRLYTDGINEIDSRLDHIKEELGTMRIPKNTLLVGEAIVDIDDSDDLGKVVSIFHSNLDKSLVLQKAYGKIRLMLFGGISFSSNPSLAWPFGLSALYDYNPCKGLQYVFCVSRIRLTFDEAKEKVIKRGWEGIVLYDRDYQLTYRTDGKAPKRPEGCYKWKPILEDDFLVRHWIPRTGALNEVKELVLQQYDPIIGKEFYCGKLGSFSSGMRQKLAEMKYPIVVQARFDTRFIKTGKIRNPRFMRIRDDKPLDTCISPKSYPEAEYK